MSALGASRGTSGLEAYESNLSALIPIDSVYASRKLRNFRTYDSN